MSAEEDRQSALRVMAPSREIAARLTTTRLSAPAM